MNCKIGTHPWRTIGSPHQKFLRKKDPVLGRSPSYSFGRATKIISRTIQEDNEVRGVGYKGFWQKHGTPGPGSYFKSKNSLNPCGIDFSSTTTSSSKFSFPLMRRQLHDKNNSAGPNAVKTDEGCLSPGLEYHAYTTFGPPY